MGSDKRTSLDPESPMSPEDIGSNMLHGSSISKRKPAPTQYPPLTNPFGSNEELSTRVPISVPLGTPILALRNPSARFNYDMIVPSSTTTTTPVTMFSGYAPTPNGRSVLTPDTEDGFAGYGNTLHKSKELTRNSRPVDWIDYDAIRPIDNLTSIVIDEGHKGRVRTVSDVPSYRVGQLPKSDGMDGFAVPWLKNPDLDEEEREMGRAMREGRLSRIKSVGKAPRRATPAPIRTGYARGSLHIEPIMIPPKEPGMTKAVQGSLDSTHSPGVLRDSEVLGIEDGSWAKAVKERGYV